MQLENKALGQFQIDRRFRGPKDSGNGGYTAGLLAGMSPLPCPRVTLLAPPPLEQRLIVEASDRGIVARREDGQVIATCKAGEMSVTPPDCPTLSEAREARSRFIMDQSNHIFPECFTCGNQRPTDGLAIFAGALEQSTTVATTWTPSSTLPNHEGVLAPAIVWSALDCPGAFAAMRGVIRPMVLGRMLADIRENIRINEEIIVLGWPVSTDGRKEHVGTALYCADGRLLALAESLWISIPHDHGSFTVGSDSRQT